MIKKSIILSFSVTLLLLISCTSIKETVYLQDAEVKGPINTPPIRITKDKSPGTITFSPRLNINKYSEISANVGSARYNDAVQDSLFRYKNKNLLWMSPELSFGFDLDIAVSKSFAICGGLNYSTFKSQKLIGGSFGIGFLFEKENGAARFDLGILTQQLLYDVKSVVVTTTDDIFSDPTTSVDYYRDIDKNSDIDFYAMLTMNSKMREFPVNFFLNLAFFNQTILKYEPRSVTDFSFLFFLPDKNTKDAREEAASAFISASPGVYLEFAEWSRLIIGAMFMYDLGLDNSSNDFLILPVMQLDVQF